MTDSTDVAVPASGGVVGMEDIGSGDLSVPRLSLNHKKGVIEDAQTKEQFDSLDCILLGVVKQRVLWDPSDESFDKAPLCKSFDFGIGFPDADEFPWGSSGFNQADFASFDQPQLDCGSCRLKEWETHPKRDKIPWCSEQWVFPLIVPIDESGAGAPALITFQRSQLTNTKSYVSGFARVQKPLFVAHTKITLEKLSRGTVDYVLPSFQKGDATPESMADFFTEQYLGIRQFLVTPRLRDKEDTKAVTAAAPAAAPAEASAPVEVVEEGEIPF